MKNKLTIRKWLEMLLKKMHKNVKEAVEKAKKKNTEEIIKKKTRHAH